jgi:death on curing protein
MTAPAISPPREGTVPSWVTYDEVVAIHHRGLRRFGGAPGLTDDVALQAALHHPLQQWLYEHADLPRLAAAYASGLTTNRGFADGNERIAFLAMMTFLRQNGVAFSPDPAQAAAIIMALAAGEVSEESFSLWIRDNWPKEL